MSTPWWAVPTISGAFVLSGVLIGQTIPMLTDRRRARREDQLRWHEQRLTLYFDYLHEYDIRETNVRRFLSSEPTDITLGIGDMETLERLESRMRLISTPPVYEAALECGVNIFLLLTDVVGTQQHWMEMLDGDQRTLLKESNGVVPRNFPEPPRISDELLDYHWETISTGRNNLISAVRRELRIPDVRASKMRKSKQRVAFFPSSPEDL